MSELEMIKFEIGQIIKQVSSRTDIIGNYEYLITVSKKKYFIEGLLEILKERIQTLKEQIDEKKNEFILDNTPEKTNKRNYTIDSDIKKMRKPRTVPKATKEIKREITKIFSEPYELTKELEKLTPKKIKDNNNLWIYNLILITWNRIDNSLEEPNDFLYLEYQQVEQNKLPDILMLEEYIKEGIRI